MSGCPDVDGPRSRAILRKNGFKAPHHHVDRTQYGFRHHPRARVGANDYVTKPFRFAVLLARIRAQLRQHEASEDAVFTIGPYTFRPSSKISTQSQGQQGAAHGEGDAILHISIAPANVRFRARPCCRRSGAIIPASPPTRSRRTSIGCARRSRGTLPALPSSYPKRRYKLCRNRPPWPSTTTSPSSTRADARSLGAAGGCAFWRSGGDSTPRRRGGAVQRRDESEAASSCGGPIQPLVCGRRQGLTVGPCTLLERSRCSPRPAARDRQSARARDRAVHSAGRFHQDVDSFPDAARKLPRDARGPARSSDAPRSSMCAPFSTRTNPK